MQSSESCRQDIHSNVFSCSFLREFYDVLIKIWYLITMYLYAGYHNASMINKCDSPGIDDIITTKYNHGRWIFHGINLINTHLKLISVSYYSLQPYLPVTQQSYQASQARQSCSTQMYAGVKCKIIHELPVVWCSFILDTAVTRTPVIMDEIVSCMLH